MTSHATPDGYAADTVVFAHDQDWHVLLIRRAADHDTEPGELALPGGHVDMGETALQAAYRELAEETGLALRDYNAELELVGVYDQPGRDPRGWYVSVAYVAVVLGLPEVAGGDDAEHAEWVPVDKALSESLAFDHDVILRDAVQRAGLPVAACGSTSTRTTTRTAAARPTCPV